MDFSLDDDHVALRDAVRRYCDRELPAQQRGQRQSAAQMAQRWAGLAELGLLGLPFDPELGGSGQGAVETMLVAQELGRALAGSAWIASVVLAGPLLAEAGTPAQCAQWLPALVAGDLRLALACGEPGARHDTADVQTTARRDGSHWVLDGHKSLVLHGDSAGLLLVVARSAGQRHDQSGLTLLAIDATTPGLRVQGFDTLDGGRAAHLELRAVRVTADRVVGTVDAAWPLIDAALDRANAALVADAAGAMEALLELCVEHLRTRKQFGAPLARFQVLQHRIADMLLAVEQAKSMACAAAMAVNAGDATQRARLVSAAKALVAPLARQAGLTAIQLHGAMGMTDECRVGHCAKRLLALNTLFGDAPFHLRRFAACSPQI